LGDVPMIFFVRGHAARHRNSLLQIAVPHREDFGPGLLGGEGVVDGTFGETEAVFGAREHFELVFGVGAVEHLFQLAGDVGGDRVIGLGEGLVELALDPVEEETMLGDPSNHVAQSSRIPGASM